MKTFSQNQMMLKLSKQNKSQRKLAEFKETKSRPKTNNRLRKKVNVVNNKKNQQIRKKKNN